MTALVPFAERRIIDMTILIEKEGFFMPVAKEQIRQIIADNNLNSVADVYLQTRSSTL